MDISELERVAKLIAPEVCGRLSLHIAESGNPFPPGAAAVFSADPPPWLRAKGFHLPCIVFRNRQWATIESLTHELAHFLPVDPDAPSEREPRSEESKYFAAWSMDDLPSLQAASHVNPSFIRRCIHLKFRCFYHDWAVNLEDALAGCGADRLPEYQRALQGEPRRCLNLSFWEIEQLVEAPPAFLELFDGESGCLLAPRGAPVRSFAGVPH